jgi:hypothetical protein
MIFPQSDTVGNVCTPLLPKYYRPPHVTELVSWWFIALAAVPRDLAKGAKSQVKRAEWRQMSCEVVRILASGWTRVCAGIAAVALCTVVLGGCATRPATQAQAKLQAKAQAKYVKPKRATRMLTARARIPLPDRTLLQRQAEPDCTFRATISIPITGEELRQKLDYEQQCYRQSESNVRVRLHTLQDAVGETIRAVEER